MRDLLQDLRYTLRNLVNRPGFTAVVIVTLSLGIGANTAIFSVINAVVLRPLSYDHPGELVMVWETNEERGSDQSFVSYPDFEDWKAQNDVFEEIGAIRSSSFTLTGVDAPLRIRGAAVSTGFFSALRVNAAIGRTFRPEEDRAGAPNVVVVSDGFWRRHLAANPDLVGQTLMLDGIEFAVVGVLPQGFDFPVRISGAELWTPTGVAERWLDNRGGHTFRTIARLKPGITLRQAQADMDTIAARLEHQYPDSNTGRGVNVVPLHEQVVGDVRPTLLILLGAVGLVLLIACANVANLLLARSASRRQELAVRAALGAGRGRLIRQLLTESTLLGILGGVLGILLALWCKDALVAIIPQDIPRVEDIGLDGWVLTFTLVVALGTGLVFGLAPALNATRLYLPASLKEGGYTTASAGRHRLRGFLVVSEVAVALVLLVGAGLLMRSFMRLTNVDLGFQPESIMTFEMVLPRATYADNDRRAELYRQVVDRVATLPGVTSACAGTTLPLSGSGIGLNFSIVGREETEGTEALFDSVSADYFETLGIPLIKGRTFTKRDRREGLGVMVINRAMAQMIRRLHPDSEPIGLRLKISANFGENDPELFEIVGIVGDVRWSVADEPEPHMYVPFKQQTWPSMYFAVRTVGDPSGLVSAVRGEVAAVTSDVAPYNFKTIERYFGDSLAHRLFALLLLGIFAALALALAAVGIYGMLSYSVAEQTHEIGLRMALGALDSDVLRAVLRRGLTLTGIGIGIGMAVSFAVTRVLSSFLYDVSTFDPVTLLGVPVLLIVVALPACYIPASRAMKVDPLVALRCE
ncbi:MAG: ABC transporter permease [Phycisphaerae bacterium]